MFEDPYGILQLSATKKNLKTRKKVKYNPFKNFKTDFFLTLNNIPMDIVFEKYWELYFIKN